MAVEFALVVPVLVLLLFGIIDYGLWFSDTLSARSGVRDAARAAVVGDFGACTSKTDLPNGHSFEGAPTDAARDLVCTVRDRTGSVTGDIYIKVAWPEGWAPGKNLYVCELIKEKGITGYVPLPNDDYIRARAVMTIEQQAPTGLGDDGAAETVPSDQSWTDDDWCVPAS